MMGEIQIPVYRGLFDFLTRLDEQLESMIKLQVKTNELLEGIAKALGAGPTPITLPPTVTPTPPVTTVEEALNNRYKVFSLNLSKARDNEPLGLRDYGIIAKSAVVTELGSTAYWRRNDPRTGDLEKLYTGYRVDNFTIEELYITNPAGTGFLTIVVEWRE
jgi:hypothetical protein